MNRLTPFAFIALVAGCVAPTLDEYRPVTDSGAKGAGRYESDLQQCRRIAIDAEQKYKAEQDANMGANMMAGILVGAIIGGAIGGSDYVGYGAAHGALSGAAATDFEQAHGGPRRIIDRCMNGRGHRVLSDLGRG